MPKQKTLPAVSIDNELYPTSGAWLPKTGDRMFKTMSKGHVNEALTIYLRSMSLINDDEEVTNFNKAPDSLDVKVEKIT